MCWWGIAGYLDCNARPVHYGYSYGYRAHAAAQRIGIERCGRGGRKGEREEEGSERLERHEGCERVKWRMQNEWRREDRIKRENRGIDASAPLRTATISNQTRPSVVQVPVWDSCATHAR